MTEDVQHEDVQHEDVQQALREQRFAAWIDSLSLSDEHKRMIVRTGRAFLRESYDRGCVKK